MSIKSLVRPLLFIFVSLLFGFLFISPAKASAYTLSGKVTDSANTAISSATITVTDSATSANVGTTTTDGSGNYSITVSGGTYNVQLTPPANSNFTPVIALNQSISADKTLNFILVPTGTVTLSGHIYNQQGIPIPNAQVYLPGTSYGLISTTTDANGAYSLTLLPGFYPSIDVDLSGSDTLQLPPTVSLRSESGYSFTQSTILDFTLAASKVTVYTKDSAQNFISGVQISKDVNSGYGYVTAGGISFRFYSNYPGNVTDSSGKTILWLPDGGYTLKATPPSGSNYVTTTAGISVSGETQATVVLPAPITLSGHIYNQLGTPVPNAMVYLPGTSYGLISTRTDANGAYSLSFLPGSYPGIDVDMSGSNTLQMAPTVSLRSESGYTFTQNTILDFTIITKQVTVHVTDAAQNAISSVKVTMDSNSGYGHLTANGISFRVYSDYSSGVLTDYSGNATLWLPVGGYTLKATPPSGSSYITTTSGVSVTDTMQTNIVLPAPLTVNGNVTNQLGIGIPNAMVYLPGTSYGLISGTTNANGVYSLSLLPGTYPSIDVDLHGSDSLQLAPNVYLRSESGYTFTQNTTFNFSVVTKKVTIHVQDAAQIPISGIQISMNSNSGYGYLTANGIGFRVYSEYTPGVMTNTSGDVILWLPTGGYSIKITPPSGSNYLTTTSSLSVTTDQVDIISLQFNHARPTTTGNLSPDPDAQGNYPDPTTVTLSATAASGYTIANTYYTIDGGTKQTYSAPFTVTGGGSHAVSYWSIDNSGVYESPNTKTFTIHTNTPPTVTITGSNSVNEGSTVTYTFSVSDPDAGDTFSVVSTPSCGTNGTYVQNSLTLTATGGTFQCSFPSGSTSSTVSIQVADSFGATSNTATESVTVNNVAPTVGAIDAPISPVEPGDSVYVDANFSDPGGTGDSFTSTINWGDGNTTNGTITETNGSGTVTGSHTYTTPGTYTITLSVTDNNGASTSSTTTIVVNAPPTAQANGPYSVNEGSDVTLNGSGTDPDGDTLTYAWDLDNNGTYETTGQSVTFHGVDGDATKTVGLQVCDTFGACATDTATITIHNVNPTVETMAITPSQPQQNGEVNASASFTDPGVLDSHTATIDWGDNTTSSGILTEDSGSGSVTGTHTYTGYGTFTITLTVTDKDGGIGTKTQQLFVNAPPVANAGGPYTINEGDTIVLSGSATDPDNDTLTYSWDLDNSGIYALTGQTALFSAEDGPATKTVNLKVCDNNGGCDISSTTVTVNNAAPTINSLTVPTNIIPLNTQIAISGAFTDPGVLDTHTAVIDWGDGSTGPGLVTESNGSGNVAGSHSYATSGPHTITLTITDNDGASGSKTTQVTVNTPPVANANGPYSVNEGSDVTLNGSGTDVDNDPLTYAWDLDNNGSYETVGQSVSYHGVDGDSTKTVGLQVCDNHGGCDTKTTTITIYNVAPTIGTITAPTSPVQVNTAINTSATFTDPGVLDTHTAVWDWGDNTTSAGSISESNGSGSTTGSHVYSASGVYTVSVTVTDKDNGSATKEYQYVVIYDPTGGYVTGGGTITSPVGAEPASSTATGKATFGFSAKYNSGTTPTGNTKFIFPKGGFDFASTSYDWLVVSGATVYLEGHGTINGAGNYTFLLSAIDGSPDNFRIKITDLSGTTIYDNQIGTDGITPPTQAIDSGQITVH